jgi:hypothetical protein
MPLKWRNRRKRDARRGDAGRRQRSLTGQNRKSGFRIWIPESGRFEAPHLHQIFATRKPLIQRNLALVARLTLYATTKPMVRCIGELRHKFHATVTRLRIFGALLIETFAFLAEEKLE